MRRLCAVLGGTDRHLAVAENERTNMTFIDLTEHDRSCECRSCRREWFWSGVAWALVWWALGVLTAPWLEGWLEVL